MGFNGKSQEKSDFCCILYLVSLNCYQDCCVYLSVVIDWPNTKMGAPFVTNNDVLRSIRYTFDYSDSKMMAIFKAGNLEVSREQLSQWLKKDDDPDFRSLHDLKLAIFLNGLINKNRGEKPGPQVEPEKKLTNNLIFKKLKIAMDLKSEDILEVLSLAGFKLSNQELSALFRRPDHKNYRQCKDQILRNFLKGLRLKYRSDSSETETDD